MNDSSLFQRVAFKLRVFYRDNNDQGMWQIDA